MVQQIPKAIVDEAGYLAQLLDQFPDLKAIRIRRGGPNSNVHIVQIEMMNDLVWNILEPK